MVDNSGESCFMEISMGFAGNALWESQQLAGKSPSEMAIEMGKSSNEMAGIFQPCLSPAGLPTWGFDHLNILNMWMIKYGSWMIGLIGDENAAKKCKTHAEKPTWGLTLDISATGV